MKTFKILLIIISQLLLFSCEDVLDRKTISQWPENKVWNIPELAEGVLTQAYAAIDVTPDCFDGNFLDAATDNAITNAYSSNIYRLANGNYSAANNPIGNWDKCYNQMQNIHEFMEKGLRDDLIYVLTNDGTADDVANAETKKRLRGEAYFLRAWWGFQLLQRYGGRTDDGEALGYPIVDHFITIDEASKPSNFKRNTYRECTKQIIEDCDSAMKYLPLIYAGESTITGIMYIGRASGMAAAVLKSRTALYNASPAFQDKYIVSIKGMGNFEVINSDEYVSNWEYAALVADTMIRKLDGFGEFVALKSVQIADAPNTTPSDFVFRMYYNNNTMETNHFPPYYRGGAQNVPTQNLVDAFYDNQGFPITDSRTNYNPNNPYQNRDKRLDLIVYYHGRKFGENDYSIDIVEGHRDSKEFHKDASRTGYYLAKFMSTKKGLLLPTAKQTSIHYNPLLRKSEVFLNFAEAANEAWGPMVKGPGCKYSAYEVIKRVRKLSGGFPDNDVYLDEVASRGQDAFRKLIQNERRLEFAFENHRFFDMRRWLLPLDEDIRGVKVIENEDNTYSYYMNEVIEDRGKLNDVRYYYLPLPYEELLKNPNLKNNMGWNNN